jgi:hypothetical protein
MVGYNFIHILIRYESFGNLDISSNRSEIPCKFLNAVLEEDEED